MGFKQEFDKIMEDLVGEVEELKDALIWDYDEDDIDSVHHFDYSLYEKRFHQRYLNEQLEGLRRKTDDLYKKYEASFINYFCENHIYKCSCGQEFILHTFTHPAEKERQRMHRLDYFEGRSPMDVMQEYTYHTYFCMFCGRPFDVVNGQILRVELKPEDIETLRRNKQH